MGRIKVGKGKRPADDAADTPHGVSIQVLEDFLLHAAGHISRAVNVTSHLRCPTNPFIFGSNLLESQPPDTVPLFDCDRTHCGGEGIAEELKDVNATAVMPDYAQPVSPGTALSEIERHYLHAGKNAKLTAIDMAFVLPGRSMEDLKRAMGVKRRKRAAAAAVQAAPQSPGGGDATTAVAASGSAADRATHEQGHAPPRMAVVTEMRLAGTADLGPGLGRMDVMVRSQPPPRPNGERRVTLLEETSLAAQGNTVALAHRLASLSACRFYAAASVTDPAEPSSSLSFRPTDMEHCTCLHIGISVDGSPLLSWSRVLCLYTLPDGSSWLEHEDWYDLEDLQAHADKTGRMSELQDKLPQDLAEHELVHVRRRMHSRLSSVEYECWLFKGSVPDDLPGNVQANAFCWRYTMDPATLDFECLS